MPMKRQAFILYVIENVSEVEKEIEKELRFEAEWKRKLKKAEEEGCPIEDEKDTPEEDEPVLSLTEVMEIL